MSARVLDLPPGTRSPSHVLSKTGAALLIDRSPRHAYLRKAGQWREEPTKAMEMGTIVHAILLGKSAQSIEVVTGVKAWNTKVAKEKKAEIIAAGGLPILESKANFAQRAAERIRRRMIEEGYRLTGVSELAIEWTEEADNGDEVTCWGALDHWLPADGMSTIIDLKIVDNAHPRACERSVKSLGGLIQAAAYTSAIAKLYPETEGRTRFVFLFCEVGTGEPTPIVLGGELRRLGELQWQRAVNEWAHGQRTGEWPGYAPRGPIVLEAKPWDLEEEMALSQGDTDE